MIVEVLTPKHPRLDARYFEVFGKTRDLVALGDEDLLVELTLHAKEISADEVASSSEGAPDLVLVADWT
jgi:hypothetical protein